MLLVLWVADPPYPLLLKSPTSAADDACEHWGYRLQQVLPTRCPYWRLCWKVSPSVQGPSTTLPQVASMRSVGLVCRAASARREVLLSSSCCVSRPRLQLRPTFAQLHLANRWPPACVKGAVGTSGLNASLLPLCRTNYALPGCIGQCELQAGRSRLKLGLL